MHRRQEQVADNDGEKCGGGLGGLWSQSRGGRTQSLQGAGWRYNRLDGGVGARARETFPALAREGLRRSGRDSAGLELGLGRGEGRD